MLTLLLFLVLNHSVMAVGADRDDADVDFDLGYAILLGGLFVLLVYQLIPRRQRKISYEEQEDFEEEVDDVVPQKSAEADQDLDEDLPQTVYMMEKNLKADEDPDRDILKTTPREYIEALLSMFQLMALDRSNVKHWYPASVLQLVFDEDAWTLKAGIVKKAVTLDLLKRVCRRIAPTFAAMLNMSISSLLYKRLTPEGLHGEPVPGETSDEQLRTLIAVQLFERAADPTAALERDVYAWLHALESEDGKTMARPEDIEQYLVSLAEEVIDKLAEACSGPDRFGPDGPTHANREIVKAFRERVKRDLGC